ncbi:MAG: hypothetical protein JW797_09515, partial [Bradymonadales bacterium]|nr:hypothetical protein [Bradymonadales bacterium]
EPTSCGRDYGNTNCMMFNMVAPLEMALRDGYHPLLEEQVGPHTGKAETFETFEQFLQAYFDQLAFLIDTAFEANNLFGEVHKVVRPVPFLSALLQGPMGKGQDLSEGGALYNSSGTGNVGLVDVVDSLVAIKKVVFEERHVELATLQRALDANFEGYEELWTRLSHKVPKFGAGHEEPKEILRRVMACCYEAFSRQPHYRGGYYKPGYWSMSNHVAFGILSSALPSGRKKGQPFTPGITPAPARGVSFTAHIHDVAAIEGRYAPNNLAFNVKVVPAPHDTQEQTVERMAAYVRTYVQEGGLQLQFNVVSSELLRDAMAHPGKYPSLMVRISGYNAYFDDLNEDMKLELIARTEHPLGA